MQLIGPAQQKNVGLCYGCVCAATSHGGLFDGIYLCADGHRSLFVLGCAALALGAILVAFLAQNKLQKKTA